MKTPTIVLTEEKVETRTTSQKTSADMTDNSSGKSPSQFC